MSTLEVNTITPQSGTTVTIGGSGQTVSLGSGATQSGFGGTNTPIAILYRPSVVQTVSNQTWTNVTFTQASYDPSSIGNATSGTITPNVAGHYMFLISTRLQNSNTSRVIVRGQKNGSGVGIDQADTGEITANASGSYATVKSWFIEEANGSTDYFYFQVYHNTGSNAAFLNSSIACFKLIT